MKAKTIFCLCLIAAGYAACSTSPIGRKQLVFMPDDQMNDMGAKAFSEMRQQIPTESDPAVNAYVRCVAAPITKAASGQLAVKNWEIVVFREKSANAFALPGGKIGVHTGILPVARNQDQLAAVLGHEVGHVIARHGAERVSRALATQGGLAVVDAFILGRETSATQRALILAGLGLGAQVGVELPHSRTQETEADLIGLELMAKAGFDPRQSVDLWRNMGAAAGGSAPPEWLSTHPTHETRIRTLEENLAKNLPAYHAAVAAGNRAQCRPPAAEERRLGWRSP